MSRLGDLLLGLPAWVVLLVAFALPAAEASTLVGVVVPGETAVLVAGALAHAGRLPLAAVVAAAGVGAVLGDQVGFRVGRRLGPALLERIPAGLARHARPASVLDLVRRRGATAVVIGRWTASLRALVPGLAGASGLAPRRFLAANVVGGTVWAAAVAVLGYLAGAGLQQVESRLSLGGTLLLALVAVSALLGLVLRRRRRKDRPEEDGLEEGGDQESPADGRPRFSVVVPAYNEVGYLGRTLESLQQQDFPGPYEVIVVDNRSTDGTGELAAGYGVRVVSEPEPGVCAARQRGSLCARGEVVVSTDADTVHPHDWLRRLDARFRRSPGVVAVAGPCRYDDRTWWVGLYPRLLFGVVHWVAALTGRVCYLSATNTAFRRSAFPGYDVTMSSGGDELDLLRRLRRRGRVVWDPGTVVTTSARRLERGLVYNLVVSFGTYYLLAYLLHRVTSRRLVGAAPAVRLAPRQSPPDGAPAPSVGSRRRSRPRPAPARSSRRVLPARDTS